MYFSDSFSLTELFKVCKLSSPQESVDAAVSAVTFLFFTSNLTSQGPSCSDEVS
jgi:hypothetical protein